MGISRTRPAPVMGEKVEMFVRRVPLFFALIWVVLPAYAQIDSVEPVELDDPLDLIDSPTAKVLSHGAYDMTLKLYNEGGVLSGIRVGLLDRVMFGFTFGGLKVLGTGTPDWNPRVEFEFRGKLLGESYLGPAVALGFNSQGLGFYAGGVDRYQFKSKGFYAVATKHFLMLGEVGLSGGVNYSLERDDDDEEPDLFIGLEKSISPNLDLITEYDVALNDNSDNGGFGEGKGYLNAGLLWRVSRSFRLAFEFRNLLENHEGGTEVKDIGDWSREIRINYIDYF